MPLPPQKMSTNLNKEDFYAVLNISPLAPDAEIPHAYRRAALLAHPDKGGSTEAFQLVSNAFEVLACRSSREQYDQARKHGGLLGHTDGSCKPFSRSDMPRAATVVKRGTVKRSAPEAGAPPKKQRVDQPAKDSAAARSTASDRVNHVFRGRVSPEEALSRALNRLKTILHDMCMEQRRQAISQMVLRVRIALLTFMEKQKKESVVPDARSKPETHEVKAVLPLADAPVLSSGKVTDGTCIDEPKLAECKSPATQPVFTCIGGERGAQVVQSGSDRSVHVADIGRSVQKTCNFDIARRKQARSASATTGIQRDRRYKRSSYKAQLHIKSLRIYTKGHASIESAIDHQIILMQIRLAWMEAWQSNAHIWEEHPHQLASLYKHVLLAKGTSENELGLKAFVSMQALPWLGKNCFVISPVMELTDALELQAKLLRARRISWPLFRAEWVQLMQRKKHYQPNVRSEADAEGVADGAYQRHQMFLRQLAQEREKRKEARSHAQQQLQEKAKQKRDMRCYERDCRKRERQIERQKLLGAQAERWKLKKMACLEKYLAKAVRAVERALDLKARSDAHTEKVKARQENSRLPKKRQQTLI